MKAVFNLKPTTSQVSFYGKAKVEHEKEGVYLRSYDTRVAMIDNNGKFHRLWDGYSATSQKHINSFRETYGLSRISKAEWANIKCEN